MNVTELKASTPVHGYWYVATPYSKWKHGLEDANEVAQKLTARLMSVRVPVFSPIAHTHGIAAYVENVDKRDHDFWLKSDEPVCRSACGLLIADLPGWKESEGVALEIEWHRKDKKPIYILNTKTLDVKRYRG